MQPLEVDNNANSILTIYINIVLVDMAGGLTPCNNVIYRFDL